MIIPYNNPDNEYDEGVFLDYIASANFLLQDNQRKLAGEFLQQAINHYECWDFGAFLRGVLREVYEEEYNFLDSNVYKKSNFYDVKK